MGQYEKVWDLMGPCRTIKDHKDTCRNHIPYGQYRTIGSIQDHTRPYDTTRDHTWQYWTIRDCTGRGPTVPYELDQNCVKGKVGVEYTKTRCLADY